MVNRLKSLQESGHTLEVSLDSTLRFSTMELKYWIITYLLLIEKRPRTLLLLDLLKRCERKVKSAMSDSCLIIRYERLWECPECNKQLWVSYERLANSGSPLCICGWPEMTMEAEFRLEGRAT